MLDEEKELGGIGDYGWTDVSELEDHRYNFRAIEKLLPTNCTSVLDAGCGTGIISSKLAKLGYKVIGIDAARDGISLARDAFPDIRFELCSLYDDLAQVVETPVDLIISCEVIEHLFSPRKFLVNMNRILKPGGYIILTTPYHGYLKNLAISLVNGWDKHLTVDWEGGHIKFFSKKSLKAMLVASGFEDVRFCGAGRMPLLWKSMVCRARKPVVLD